MRRLSLTIALLAATTAIAACGGSDEAKPKPAPGTPGNPLVARVTADDDAPGSAKASEPSASAAKPDATPGYQQLVKRQAKHPQSRFTPCSLVTRAEAAAIVGNPVTAPVEAPQGPTCIYRSRNGRDFVTLAVQAADFRALTKPMRKPQHVAVSSRTAVCGVLGQPILYVPAGPRQVLTVTGPCDVAQRFAAKAVPRIKG
jgi:hypothetical protein